MPRDVEDWERCDKSPFTGAHAWARDGLCGFCQEPPPPGDPKERVMEALRQLKHEDDVMRSSPGKLELK